MTRSTIPGRVHELHRELPQLDREALQGCVRTMAAEDVGEYQIAALLGLHIDTVRRVLGNTQAALHKDCEPLRLPWMRRG
jgi:hypothetical protein